MSHYQKKILKGTSLVFFSTYISAFFGYVLRVLLARSLSIKEYGLVFSIISFFGIFAIFSELGLGNALAKFIPEFIAKKEYSKIKTSFESVLIINLFLSFLIGLIIIIFSKKISTSFFHNESAWILIIIYSIFFILNPILLILKSAFQGFFKMGLFGLVNISQSLFVLVGTYVLIFMGYKSSSLFVSYLIYVILASFVFYFIFTKKVFSNYSNYKYVFNLSLIKKILKFGIIIALSGAFGMIFGRIDTFLLSLLNSLEEAAYFQVIFPLVKALWDVGSILSVVLLPIISEMWSKKHFEKFNKELEKLYSYTLIILIPLCSFLFVYSKEIIILIYGVKYLAADLTLKILSVAVIVKAITKINNVILVGINKPAKLIKYVLVGSFLNISLNLMLIPIFGSVGASISLLASFLCILILSFVDIKKHTKIRFDINTKIKITSINIFIFFLMILFSKYVFIEPFSKVVSSLCIFSISYVILLLMTKTITIQEINLLIRMRK